MKLHAIIHENDEGNGYWAEVPAIPDCFTDGLTLVEIKENAKDAILGWLHLMDMPLLVTPRDTLIEIEV